jgi:hypothetical protein
MKRKEKIVLTKDNIQASMHSFKQMFGDKKIIRVIADMNKTKEIMRNEQIERQGLKTLDDKGLTISKKLKNEIGFGVKLTYHERKLLDGILRVFTEFNYEGHQKIKTRNYINKYNERNSSLIEPKNSPYKRIEEVPVIRVTFADLLEISGYGKRQIDKQKVQQALAWLSLQMCYFSWNRISTDGNGKPEKKPDGTYKMELVQEISTILRTQAVYEDDAQKVFKYYEISLPAVFLDDIKTYFVLYPYDWMTKVREITGNNKHSFFTYDFLLWLRMRAETDRKHNKKNTKNKRDKIHLTLDQIGEMMNLTSYMMTKGKYSKTTQKNIFEALDVAKKLNYLLDFEVIDVDNYTISLNYDFYPKPKKL